jgi:Bacterial SH3 domain
VVVFFLRFGLPINPMKYATLLGLAIVLASITAARATTESCAVVLNTPDGFLALREGPGTQFRIKDKLSPSQTVGITTEDCIWHRRGNVTCNKWVRVKVFDDQTPTSGWAGWVRSKYIQPVATESGKCRPARSRPPSPAMQ